MPNITRTTHADCARLEVTSTGEWNDRGWWGRPGDVRRCTHGKVQIRTETSIRSRMQGPGTDWWRTLSPVWNPLEYRRARKALA
jgi:hypothetical protein